MICGSFAHLIFVDGRYILNIGAYIPEQNAPDNHMKSTKSHFLDYENVFVAVVSSTIMVERNICDNQSTKTFSQRAKE